jgi:hypothetical protein
LLLPAPRTICAPFDPELIIFAFSDGLLGYINSAAGKHPFGSSASFLKNISLVGSGYFAMESPDRAITKPTRARVGILAT